MPRYKLTIAYNGQAFCGWQRQVEDMTVQQALEEAFLKFTGTYPSIVAAGRTDSGVHATGQVVHVDLEKDWRNDVVRDAVNQHLAGHLVAIMTAEKVDGEFHARFSALRRHYVYKLLNRRSPPVFERGLVWHLKRKLNVEAMREAAQLLVGHHDFSTFRDAECQAESPMRTMERFDVSADGEMIYFHLSARSFLHRQVRSMVGSLEHVGSGKWKASDLKAALEAKDRAACGAVAPPDGLYLARVDYPDAQP